MRGRRGRGTFRTIVGGVALVATALLTPQGAAAQPEPPPGLIPEGDWHPSQIAWMVAEIRRTEQVLPERFPASFRVGSAEEAQLEAMGFHNFGATAPGRYDHWINNAWVVDQHFLNPTYSESLVYRNVGDGVWELQAAMYMLPPDWEEPPALIAWLPGWHGHPELCISDADGTFAGITDPENPDCPAGSHPGTTPLMMHVWLLDPGCGHRFGGVGVQGLHCDVSHHDMNQPAGGA